MKLIFAGTEAEKQWFRNRLGCPNGVPCPKHHENGTLPIDPKYHCADCYAHNGTTDNVTYVDVLPNNAGGVDIASQLKNYAEQFKNCAGCTFMVNGKCFFDYNCPADFKAVKGGSICDDMPVSESN